ncbi:MAG: hypothetical protein WC145_11765 [Aliarcobacter sp.]|jgi:hypothetical protein
MNESYIDRLPQAIIGPEGRSYEISRIVDLIPHRQHVVVALVDLERGEDSLPGIVIVIHLPQEGGSRKSVEIVAQNDWQSPSARIPNHLEDLTWPQGVTLQPDGIPRYLPGYSPENCY